MNVWYHYTGDDDDDELPPTLGVREPREPSPPTLTGGAEAPLSFTPDVEAAALAEGTGLAAVDCW